MPIPPRPIPNPHAQQRRHPRRPGVNLAGGGQSLISEGRADVSILPRGASAPNTLSGVFVRPRSFSPLHSPISTSPLRHSPLSSSPMRTPPPPSPPRREVPLAQLMDGRGRAPRTGAAAALGFDVVPRPTVVPIEDEKATEPQPTEPRSSLWAWRERYRAATPPAAPVAAGASGSLYNEIALGPAPQTPALDPHITDDEDDWEHVDAEEDTVFGELELDTDIDQNHVLPSGQKDTKLISDVSKLPTPVPKT
ncbi:hypothetical protein CC85DRAFT_289215 [Cutaneotrichosporon oleaginosum]|uniref:Uncharacterized protein n=1 Tax=Cutaneotrichosporon oleaginosum TaxID=879819 RepID=A0A0J1ATX7_9TREE|nr:uncharacterized protein CC85DRAFT_289215 [Cutaneotrichosporon oleaginosum]KLT38769.1 hypothetical protein CC85DRAFT_289215 [Cutaneotrichosporon oleaginosum]TXT11495.1 hypothetical protein COLE_01905 [Cutaneotrichosporon oleaginosum]